MTTVFNNGQDLQEACRHLCTRTIKPECTSMEQYDVRGPRVGIFHEPPYECVAPGVLSASISSIIELVLRHFARAFRLRILEWETTQHDFYAGSKIGKQEHNTRVQRRKANSISNTMQSCFFSARAIENGSNITIPIHSNDNGLLSKQEIEVSAKSVDSTRKHKLAITPRAVFPC